MSLAIREITTGTPEWKLARAIRWKVFVEEQGCPPDEEWDEHDAHSHHYLGRFDDQPVATARWRSVAYNAETAAKLERFAVVKEERGKGYGRQMVTHLIEAARNEGHDTLILHAQSHLEEFYESFGFERVGEPFEEAGIRHVKMVSSG
jgi:predicted GNAT family N-acyltransferase